MATAARETLDESNRFRRSETASSVVSIQKARLRRADDLQDGVLRAPNGEAYDHCFIASTERLATDGGIIKTSAWDISKMRNRWLSNHDIYSSRLDHVVLGHIVHARVETGLDPSIVGPSGRALVEWVKYGRTEFAQNVFMLFEDGDLDEVSVRWDPRSEYVRPPHDQEVQANPGLQWVGEYVVQLELSGVIIAADAGAQKRGMLPVVNPRVIEAFERIRSNGAARALPALESFIRRHDFNTKINMAVAEHVQHELELARAGVPPMSPSDVVAAQLAGQIGMYADTNPPSASMVMRDDQAGYPDGGGDDVRDQGIVDNTDGAKVETQQDVADQEVRSDNCIHCDMPGDHSYRVCRACVDETKDEMTGKIAARAMTADQGTGGALLVGTKQASDRATFDQIHPTPDAAGNIVPSAVTTKDDDALQEGAVRKCSRCMRSKHEEDTMPVCDRCWGDMPKRDDSISEDEAIRAKAAAKDDKKGKPAAKPAAKAADDKKAAAAKDDKKKPKGKDAKGKVNDNPSGVAPAGQSKASGDKPGADDNDGPDGDADADDQGEVSSADNADRATSLAIEASQSAKSAPSKASHEAAQKAHAAASKVNKQAFTANGDHALAANSLMHEEHAKMHGVMAGAFSDEVPEAAKKPSAMGRSDDDVRFNPNHDAKGEFSSGDGGAEGAAKAAAMSHSATMKAGVASSKAWETGTKEDHQAAAEAHKTAAKFGELAVAHDPSEINQASLELHKKEASQHEVAAGGQKTYYSKQEKASVLSFAKQSSATAAFSSNLANKQAGAGASKFHAAAAHDNINAANAHTAAGQVTVGSASKAHFGKVDAHLAKATEHLDAAKKALGRADHADDADAFAQFEAGRAAFIAEYERTAALDLNVIDADDDNDAKATAADMSALNPKVPKSPNDPVADPDGDQDNDSTEGALPQVNLINEPREYEDLGSVPDGVHVLAPGGSIKIGGVTIQHSMAGASTVSAAVGAGIGAGHRDEDGRSMRGGMDAGAVQDVLVAIGATMDALDAVLSAIGPVREQLDGNFSELRNLITSQIDAPDSVVGAIDKAMGGETQGGGRKPPKNVSTAKGQGANNADETAAGKPLNRADEPVVEAPEFSVDWDAVASVRDAATPGEKKSAEKEYGDVTFADAKNKKYPVDTKEHAKAAWSYINMPKNAAGYSSDELATIKGHIKSALKKFGVETSDSAHADDPGESIRFEIDLSVPKQEFTIDWAALGVR